MDTTSTTPAGQLTDELTGLTTALAALLGADLATILADRAAQAAPRLLAELTDGPLGDEMAADLLAVLWPRGDPDLSWWRTPLGLAVAPHWAAHHDGAWSHAEAAEALGVSRGTVAQLVSRGTLTRHPEGGVQIGAVIARLVRLGQRR